MVVHSRTDEMCLSISCLRGWSVAPPFCTIHSFLVHSFPRAFPHAVQFDALRLPPTTRYLDDILRAMSDLCTHLTGRKLMTIPYIGSAESTLTNTETNVVSSSRDQCVHGLQTGNGFTLLASACCPRIISIRLHIPNGHSGAPFVLQCYERLFPPAHIQKALKGLFGAKQQCQRRNTSTNCWSTRLFQLNRMRKSRRCWSSWVLR